MLIICGVASECLKLFACATLKKAKIPNKSLDLFTFVIVVEFTTEVQKFK